MRTFASRTPTVRGYYNQPNPILVMFRESCDWGDLFGSATEWLFQLARHWTEWQSPRIGSFPHDFHDPTGPVSHGHSDDTGEDTAYWDIEAVLDEVEYSNLVQDYIVHATAVLDRIYTMSELTGTSY